MADQDNLRNKINETSGIVEDTLRSISAQIGDIFRNALDETSTVSKTFAKDVQSQLNAMARSTDKLIDNQRRINAGGITSRDIQRQINNYTTQREVLEKRINNLEKSRPGLAKRLQRQLDDLNKANQDYTDGLREQEAELKKMERALGASGSLVNGMINSLGKLGFKSQYFENVKDSMWEASKSGSQLRVFLAGAGSIAKGLGQALMEPLFVFGLILKAAKYIYNAVGSISIQSTQLGKSFGYGAEQADKLQRKVAAIAASNPSKEFSAIRENLIQATEELANTTGFISEFSKDALNTQVMLTKNFGLTAEEAANVYKFSVLTGKSSAQVNDSMVGAFVATRNALRVGVPFRATMAEAAKVTGVLALNLGNNPASIVKAVIATKALGTSLEQTNRQASGLLDFQSSIEKELQAELITGKNLNLERARYAALTGDNVTLAQELSREVGSLAEFQKLNVVAQESLAGAVGLTRDELAQQLSQQKLAEESGKNQVNITKEQALEAQKRLDINTQLGNQLKGFLDKLEQQFGAKLQDTVIKIVGWVIKFADVLEQKILPNVGNILTGIKAIAAVWAGIKIAGGLGSIIPSAAQYAPSAMSIGKGFGVGAVGALGAYGLNYASQKAATSGHTDLAKGLSVGSSALTGASTGAMIGSIIPGIGTAVGAGVGGLIGAGYGIYDQYVQDGIADSGGPFVIRNKYGQTAITKAGDKLAVSPNISSNNADLGPMIAAINEVRNAISDLNAKSWDVYLDSGRVGQGLMMNQSRAI